LWEIQNVLAVEGTLRTVHRLNGDWSPRLGKFRKKRSERPRENCASMNDTTPIGNLGRRSTFGFKRKTKLIPLQERNDVKGRDIVTSMFLKVYLKIDVTVLEMMMVMKELHLSLLFSPKLRPT
jgi:hypothetical protein